MRPLGRILKKVVEFLGCVACLLGKIFTDIEARRVFLTRQKWSREWPLLHNIFWNSKGDAFAWITYGGYSIITLLLAISICIDSKSRPSYAEKIFLLIGSLMFFGVGGLVFASIDQVPSELIDNAIVLGCLSFFVAALFLVDMSEKMGKRRSDATQTDSSSIDRHNKSQSMTTLSSQAHLMDSDGNDGKNRDSMRSARDALSMHSSNPFMNNKEKQEHGFNSQPQSMHYPTSTYTEDVVESQILPTAQMPVFSKVKQPPVINHFETEPYKKILSRPYTRYHDPAQHHQDPFYEEFNNYRRQTYYQGPKVDQGKFVIRDYSQQQQNQMQSSCTCPVHHDEELENQEQEDSAIKSGYVSQVARIWDERLKTNQSSIRSHQKDNKGSTVV